MNWPRFLPEDEIRKLIGSSICDCFDNQQNFFGLRQLKYIGEDRTNGRFADITLEQCTKCSQLWLRYFFEYTRSYSDRWFRGIISATNAEKVDETTAAAYLENLDWYMGGGSHYNGKIHYLQGAIYDL